MEHPAEASSHGRQILKACSSVAQIAEDAGLTVFIEAAKAANLSGALEGLTRPCQAVVSMVEFDI